MLHYYSFRNFQSFADEVTVDFRLDSKAPENQLSVISPAGVRLSKAMVVIGANGSGKTNLIKALASITHFIGFSFFWEEGVCPFEPHIIKKNEFSEFEMQFELDKQIYRYELKIKNGNVHWEALHQKTSKSFSYLFRREFNDNEDKYLVSQKKFGFIKTQAEKVRSNCSLISAATQYDISLAKRIQEAARFIVSNTTVIGRDHFKHELIFTTAQYFSNNQEYFEQATEMLRAMDIGLDNISISHHKSTTPEGKEVEQWIPFGVHSVNGEDFSLPFFRESSGTQGAFVLLGRIIPILHGGGVAVIDELESDLHPHMLEPILSLFFSPTTNPHNAQIIFTSHTQEVLNFLQKGQIMLVEKDDDCCSDAWRLDEIKGVRTDDNFYAKYNAGAYGAVPRI